MMNETFGIVETGGATTSMDLNTTNHDNNLAKTEIDDFVSPFKPLMAEGDGSPQNLTLDNNSFTDLIDLSYSSGIQGKSKSDLSLSRVCKL